MAQDSASTEALPQVVVTATRTAVPAFDTPASISRIGSEEIRNAHSLVNISEDLAAVPGLLARDRQNYAQDVQISVRGFGARSTFGIRGVRLYVDGIPATLPDGQGQITNVELGSVGRIEVLRGPFSALYGNSSGGVINVFTEEGSSSPRLGFEAASGSNGVLRVGAKAVGVTGGLGYVISGSRFHTDGYRDHSAADRQLANAKFTLHPDEDSKLTLVLNSVYLPEAQDPLGLSRAQYEANPRGVDQSALDYNTAKTVNQAQAGLVYERRLSAAHSIQLTAYGGHRGTEQMQSIPKASQGSPLHPGGVIDLARDYNGLDARWTMKTALAGSPFTLVAGIAYDVLDEQRQGYQNFIGNTLGVIGALRRNESNHVNSFDQYLQANWSVTPSFSVNAGLRHSKVSFKSRDHYIVAGNPDDSGSTDYGDTMPVLGVLYAVNENLHLYASAGRGFETPTLNELAYRSGGQTGLNFGLQAATSNSVELGVKARLPGWGELSAAAFETRTQHEIVTQTNSGGRSTFQNAGGTKRTGLELAWSGSWWQSLKAQVAATLLNATYTDGFLTCTATPCTAPNVAIAAGNRIPGIAKGSAFASLAWMPVAGWRGGVELRRLTAVPVNDANTDAAAGFTVASANIGYVYSSERWELSGFLRGDNLTDKKYAGSVIVNEGNSRFFEPAPGRSWLIGTAATMRF
ncbi:TonB-dependent receptor [Pelomonas sp. KK5]|uniref:TonB-dependent receptor family protein n=1 Tax=Pelomonas sp. KK5 TaxID=1855730 RepID=UPI001E510192|nr:TonB-dependent receptor [Pelomonas sp. KK5]